MGKIYYIICHLKDAIIADGVSGAMKEIQGFQVKMLNVGLSDGGVTCYLLRLPSIDWSVFSSLMPPVGRMCIRILIYPNVTSIT